MGGTPDPLALAVAAAAAAAAVDAARTIRRRMTSSGRPWLLLELVLGLAGCLRRCRCLDRRMQASGEGKGRTLADLASSSYSAPCFSFLLPSCLAVIDAGCFGVVKELSARGRVVFVYPTKSVEAVVDVRLAPSATKKAAVMSPTPKGFGRGAGPEFRLLLASISLGPGLERKKKKQTNK